MAAIASFGLLSIVAGLTWYDFRTKRIPNLVTIPLLVGLMIWRWPGTSDVWLGCLFLFVAAHFGAIGGGDAKLWMALLWAAPPDLGRAAFLVMAICFLVTGALQMGWRILKKNEAITGKRSPAAWRAIPYAFWLALAMV